MLLVSNLWAIWMTPTLHGVRSSSPATSMAFHTLGIQSRIDHSYLNLLDTQINTIERETAEYRMDCSSAITLEIILHSRHTVRHMCICFCFQSLYRKECKGKAKYFSYVLKADMSRSHHEQNGLQAWRARRQMIYQITRRRWDTSERKRSGVAHVHHSFDEKSHVVSVFVALSIHQCTLLVVESVSGFARRLPAL